MCDRIFLHFFSYRGDNGPLPGIYIYVSAENAKHAKEKQNENIYIF